MIFWKTCLKIILQIKKEAVGETQMSPPDVPTTPEVDQNREKKKRKKRRMPRKNIGATRRPDWLIFNEK